jgi:hypothetical protein
VYIVPSPTHYPLICLTGLYREGKIVDPPPRPPVLTWPPPARAWGCEVTLESQVGAPIGDEMHFSREFPSDSCQRQSSAMGKIRRAVRLTAGGRLMLAILQAMVEEKKGSSLVDAIRTFHVLTGFECNGDISTVTGM